MSISGVLEDLPLADVLQFIHLGRRTGTLFLWQAGLRRAEIAFRHGRILHAAAPGQKGLARRLVETGQADQATVDRALLKTQQSGSKTSIGQALLEGGAVDRPTILELMRERVEEAIFELITWRQGEFHFEVDEIRPPDDFALDPEELLLELDLNTQMLLLEATRIEDERQRLDDTRTGIRTALDRHLERAGFATGGRVEHPEEVDEHRESEVAEVLRCQVVSTDTNLLERLQAHLPHERVRVAPVQARDAAHRVPGESASPIVVLDGREGSSTLETVASLSRIRPGCPVLVLAAEEEEVRHALDSGAVGAFVGIGDLVRACRAIVRVQAHRPRTVDIRGLGQFQQVVFNVQSGVSSATMALNLMQVISESVERAVLFLVQGEALVASGAFGFSAEGEPLAVLTRGLEIGPPLGNLFRAALAEPEPRSTSWERAELPPDLARILGRPRSGQVVVFPVPGTERTISLVYTDNGDQEERIEDLRILQLATAQVGAAFENELIGRQLGKVDWDEDGGADVH